MSNGKINVNISGGTANIGNVSQGDNNTNTVESQSIEAQVAQGFSEFFNNLEQLSSSTNVPERQIKALRREVAALKESLEKEPKSKESIAEIAQSLYEKYGWAADMLKQLFSILVL